MDRFVSEANEIRKNDPIAQPLILYFGSVLEFAQLHALKKIAAAVEELAKEIPNVRMKIITMSECVPLCAESFSGMKSVSIERIENNSHHFVRSIARGAVLLLPSNSDVYARSCLSHSLPTKLPGYLASGVPILVCGPREISQVQYALEDKWGLVTSDNLLEIQAALNQLLSDHGLRQSLVSQAIAIAQKNHNLKTVRVKFQREILSVWQKT